MTSSLDPVDTPAVAPWRLPVLRAARLPGAAGSDAEPGEPTPEEEAYARGCRDGAEREREAMDATLGKTSEAVGAALTQLEKRLKEIDREVEQTGLALALAVTEQVIGREVVCDRRIVRALVREALEAAPTDEPIEVRLHPEDLRTLSGRREFAKAEGSMRDIRWVEDPEVGRGGCFIETPSRIVDGRIAATMTRFAEAFEDA